MIAESPTQNKTLPRNRFCARCERLVKNMQKAWLVPHPDPDGIPSNMRLKEDQAGVLYHKSCLEADIRKSAHENHDKELRNDIEQFGALAAALAHLNARAVRWEEVTA